MQIDVVWQADPEVIWEADWIRELLSDYSIREVADGRFEVLLDRSIVIGSSIPLEYCEKMRERNLKFGIIHLSDEWYASSTDFYPHADFVLRNYWHKKFLGQENVAFFPLGYKRGFWKEPMQPPIKPANKRAYVWSFAGQITEHPTRWFMLINMVKIPGYLFHETFSWNGPESLSTTDYRNLLLDSIFVPCGRGYFNLDSFRVYEALECGCIPIVENGPLDYFTLQFGKHPFLSVHSWSQAPQLIQELLEDPDRLEEYRKECHQWWLQQKKQVKIKINSLATFDHLFN